MELILTQTLAYLFLEKVCLTIINSLEDDCSFYNDITFQFGGTVLTFDTLLLKPISAIGQFLSRCDEEDIDGLPLTLDAKSPLASLAMDSLIKFYNEENPLKLGGSLLKRKLRDNCGVKTVKELQFVECAIAPKIMSPGALCPIELEKHWMLLDPVRSKLVKRTLNEANSYGVKLWSQEANEDHNDWGSASFRTPYFDLASAKCPLLTRFAVGSEGHF